MFRDSEASTESRDPYERRKLFSIPKADSGMMDAKCYNHKGHEGTPRKSNDYAYAIFDRRPR
jgi:hypothetical protein